MFNFLKRVIVVATIFGLFSAVAVPLVTNSNSLPMPYAAAQIPANSTSVPYAATQTPALQATTNSSLNWAGYAATNGTYTAVSATWIVPASKSWQSGALSADAAWVGIGGVVSRDLIQTGTQAIALDSGTVQYQAWYETLPQASQIIPISIKPGDSVTATISEASINLWNISFTNNTTKINFSTQISYISSYSSAEWMEEMPSTVGNNMIPLNDFGSIRFTDAWTDKNGVRSNIEQSGAQAIIMNNIFGQTLAAPSVLADNGSGFTVVQTNNSPLPAVSEDNGFYFFPGFSFGNRHHRQFIITFQGF